MFSFLSLLLEVFQVVIAAEASIVFFILAALTLGGSAVGLTVTAPLFVIFSPILVPATIATAVLTTGFTAAGTLGALSVALVRNMMGAKGKKKQNTPSQNLLEMPIIGGYGGSFGGKPFSGTFGNKLADATAPPSGAAPASGASPGHGFGGFLANVPLEKLLPILKNLFPGFFGSKPAGGAAPSPTDGAAPTPTPAASPGKKPSPPAGKKPAPPAKKLY